jgi:hypothetical protein
MVLFRLNFILSARADVLTINQCEIPGPKGQFILWRGVRTTNGGPLTRNQAGTCTGESGSNSFIALGLPCSMAVRGRVTSLISRWAGLEIDFQPLP